MRAIRKIVRGLCHYHGLLTPVRDDQVWSDVQRFELAPEFLEEFESAHVEEDVFQYRFGVVDDADIHSGWLLRFFTRTPFVCVVYQSIEARRWLESSWAVPNIIGSVPTWAGPPE